MEQEFTQVNFDPYVFHTDNLVTEVYVDDVLMAGTPSR